MLQYKISSESDGSLESSSACPLDSPLSSALAMSHLRTLGAQCPAQAQIM